MSSAVPEARSRLVSMPVLRRHVQDAAFYWQPLDNAPHEPGLRARRPSAPTHET